MVAVLPQLQRAAPSREQLVLQRGRCAPPCHSPPHTLADIPIAFTLPCLFSLKLLVRAVGLAAAPAGARLAPAARAARWVAAAAARQAALPPCPSAAAGQPHQRNRVHSEHM